MTELVQQTTQDAVTYNEFLQEMLAGKGPEVIILGDKEDAGPEDITAIVWPPESDLPPIVQYGCKERAQFYLIAATILFVIFAYGAADIATAYKNGRFEKEFFERLPLVDSALVIAKNLIEHGKPIVISPMDINTLCPPGDSSEC
ncbi:MAG: hypothetical protein QY318_02170 [Candidatus Dojkabacteria bacterium]|nr:MAG: hypothetical protein QY318_02170 [Candidatus Dojkabacteria bacterium]